MVHLYVFNPARKIRLLSTLLYRGSKRILRAFDSTSVLATRTLSTPPKFLHVPFQTSIPTPKTELIRDADFYFSEADNGLLVFQVESTLFKVHRVLLVREQSAFRDMFSLPQPDGEVGGSENSPIILTDTAQKFKDLLWALYAPPAELFCETQIGRLLNVLELANKYCFSSLETWLIERIYTISQEPKGPLRSASSAIYGRILELAVVCSHQNLQDLITQHLICRILWYNTRPETVVGIAEKHGLHTLLGVCYFKQLVKLERMSRVYDGDGMPRTSTETQFPESMAEETRMRFTSAHQSLVNLWEQICSSPPLFWTEGCPSHTECEATWRSIWDESLEVDQTIRCGSADVLGRLKSVMFCVRRLLSDASHMSLQCKMAALESLSVTRDEVIEGLIYHFLETW